MWQLVKSGIENCGIPLWKLIPFEKKNYHHLIYYKVCCHFIANFNCCWIQNRSHYKVNLTFRLTCFIKCAFIQQMMCLCFVFFFFIMTIFLYFWWQIIWLHFFCQRIDSSACFWALYHVETPPPPKKKCILIVWKHLNQ